MQVILYKLLNVIMNKKKKKKKSLEYIALNITFFRPVLKFSEQHQTLLLSIVGHAHGTHASLNNLIHHQQFIKAS